MQRKQPFIHTAAPIFSQNPRPSARQNPTNMYFLPLQTAWTRNFSGSLDHAAWEKGLARVKPHANHRNTDISLVVIASSVTEGAENLALRQKHYKSYRLSLHGFSHYRLIVSDLSR